jgi:hypothetical protein
MTLDRLAWFIGQIARPSTLYAAGISSAIATVTIPFRTSSLSEGAVYIGAAWAGTAALYGAKAWENSRVEIARTGQDRRQPQPVEVVNAPDQPVPVEPTA